MMKSVPPNTTSVIAPATSVSAPWRKDGAVHTDGMIQVMPQQEKTSQDQRGTNRPVGNVKRKTPRPIHSAPEMRLSRVESSGGGWVPAQSPRNVFVIPVPPKSTSSSETNRPMLSLDLRQKIRRPRPQGRRESTTSKVAK